MVVPNAGREEPDTPSTNRDALEFHFREHASLRAEIESDKQHIRKLEIYALIGAGGIWSWLALNRISELRLGWFLPVVFGLFGLFQTKGLVEDILAKAAYLRCIEEAVDRLGTLQGWETFLHDRRGNRDPSSLNRVFWFSYLGVTLLVLFLVHRKLLVDWIIGLGAMLSTG